METKSINFQLTQKKTHVATMRERYESNQAFILQLTRMSRTDYYNTILETGLRFLERNYSSDSKHYKQLAYNKNSGFWKWFTSEFAIAENDYINNIGYATANNYKEFVAMLTEDAMLETILYNLIINEKLHVTI